MDEHERRRRNDELEARLREEYHRLSDAALGALRPASPDRATSDDEPSADDPSDPDGASTDDAAAPRPSVEALVGPHLDELDDVVALHDRRLPDTALVIEHLVVAPSGVYVIRARRAPGRVRVRRGVLHTSGKDRTAHVDAMAARRDAVAVALNGRDVPLTSVLCLIDGEWPLRARPFEVDGVVVTWPKALLDALAAPGPLAPPQVTELADHLHRRLPPA